MTDYDTHVAPVALLVAEARDDGIVGIQQNLLGSISEDCFTGGRSAATADDKVPRLNLIRLVENLGDDVANATSGFEVCCGNIVDRLQHELARELPRTGCFLVDGEVFELGDFSERPPVILEVLMGNHVKRDQRVIVRCGEIVGDSNDLSRPFSFIDGCKNCHSNVGARHGNQPCPETAPCCHHIASSSSTRGDNGYPVTDGGTEGPNAAVDRGKYGDLRINPDALRNGFEQIDDAGDVKAKVWESDDGDRRLYLRIRDHDDGRRFNEYSVDLDGGSDD